MLEKEFSETKNINARNVIFILIAYTNSFPVNICKVFNLFQKKVIYYINNLMKKLICVLTFIISSLVFSQDCDLEKMKWTGMPFDKDGVFHEECIPQILYSWVGSPETINSQDHLWPFRRKTAIFFHRTPLATSIYGSFSYRVKLKSNVVYKLVSWNEAHYKCLYPESEKKNTVYVNQDPNGFSEYVLCSPGPVESWSFGLAQHHQEMSREYNLIKQNGALNTDGFLNPNTRKYGCEKCFQGYTIHDARNDGSEQTILKSIDFMEHFSGAGRAKMYNLIDGRVYRQGSKVDEHFKTNLKLPFHK